MTNRPALLRQIYTEARPYVEQLVELNVAFTGFRKLATDNGLDWGQIKALLRAEIEDGEEGGSEKVDRIIKKAEFAGEYAALLGLGSTNMNNQNSISAPPIDRAERSKRRLSESMDDSKAMSAEALALGLISKEAHAETVRLADGIASKLGAGVLNPEPDPEPKPPHDPTTGELIENDRKSVSEIRKDLSVNEEQSEIEPASAPSDAEAGQGEGGRPPSVAPSEEGGSCALGASPSSQLNSEKVGGFPVAAAPRFAEETGGRGAVDTSVEANDGSKVVTAGRDRQPVPSDPYAPQASDGRLTEKETGDPVGSGAASAGFLIAGKSPDPSHQFPCEANGWAGLEPLPQFDRREKAA